MKVLMTIELVVLIRFPGRKIIEVKVAHRSEWLLVIPVVEMVGFWSLSNTSCGK